ncbi:hypothetical protein [Actinomadura sp. 9N215]|uniref:hypothetical protein n=1 Tax=Actinomadura sp. 9N215 TaxID=3375150 RepID=UPI0037AE5D48
MLAPAPARCRRTVAVHARDAVEPAHRAPPGGHVLVVHVAGEIDNATAGLLR